MAKSTKEFYVKLDGIELSADAAKRIEAGIQAAVLSELAGYKPDPNADPKPTGPVVFIPPKRWVGLIARRLQDNELLGLKGLKEDLNVPGIGRR